MLRRYWLLGTLILAMASPLFAVEKRKPLVVTVDHFYLVSEDSERLFQSFRNEFKLPLVWPFKSYGDFGSGGYPGNRYRRPLHRSREGGS